MPVSFGQMVKNKRMELGLSQKKLGHLAGVTGTYIADMENFGKIPKDSVILKMAEALGIDPAFFLFLALTERYEEDDDVVKLYEKAFLAYSQARTRGELNGPPDELLHPDVEATKVAEAIRRGFKVIIADPEQVRQEPFRSMVEEIEDHVQNEWPNHFLDFKIASGRPIPYHECVPMISYVSAGEPFQWTDGGYEAGSGLEMLEMPPGINPELVEKIYAVRVRGDSMAPFLKEGATLFVKPESRDEVRHGDYVIFKDQEYNAWVKMLFFHEDKLILRSLNANYPDMVKTRNELVLLEKVIAVTF